MSERFTRFDAGSFAVIADVIRMENGSSSLSEELMEAYGVTMSKIKKAEPYDQEVLIPLRRRLNEEQSKKEES